LACFARKKEYSLSQRSQRSRNERKEIKIVARFAVLSGLCEKKKEYSFSQRSQRRRNGSGYQKKKS
jgi:hypothetical protein